MKRSYPSKILCLFIYLLCTVSVVGQASNNSQDRGAINVTLPRTPESQAFERYGNIPVSELTGTASIAVPIYTLKSRFWEVPIALNYNTGGIRVSQEASWVGLGFDLSVGGRITLETKGCIDADAPSLYSPSQLKIGFQKLINRLGATNGWNLLTFASVCPDCSSDTTIWPYNIPDHFGSVNAMAQYGVGEPDIYRANFMGQSLAFYFNILTDSLEFIGDRSLFDIALTKDSFGKILTWTLKDNLGNVYFFTQRETTTMTMPPLGPLVNNTSTTAWLLTKMVHPSGDSIVYTYSGFGDSYPVNPKSASMTFVEDDLNVNFSNDNEQNEVIQTPLYLTKVESNSTAVEFILGNREDIKGSGSKRLNEVRVKDKIANVVKRRSTFTYDYFNGSLTPCYTSLHDSIAKYYRLRLKLTEVKVADSSSLQPPYKFYYNANAAIPHKLSYSIDHWGYYNGFGVGEDVSPCSPRNLIPNTGLGTELGRPELNGLALDRDADSANSHSMILERIEYPTGGSSKFVYEPHDAPFGGVVGAGLRVKSIYNYLQSRLVNSFHYTYSGGTYMGAIKYKNTSFALSTCDTDPGEEKKHVLSSSGTLNDHDLLVAYSSVKKTERDERHKQNGYTIKTFNVPNPRASMGGYGYNVREAHFPVGTVCNAQGQNCQTWTNTTEFLYPLTAPFAPTPTRQLDGKLLKEEFFDNGNTLVKSVNYYYTQSNYSEKYYSIKAIDNRIGGAGGSCGPNVNYAQVNGARRYTVFLSLAKSYFTHTDSVVEKTYHSGNVFTMKKQTRYNAFHQPEMDITYNSDSSQTIIYTKTSLDLSPNYPLAPTGDAILLADLKTDHIYDLPIEQVKIVRTRTGDSLVVESKLNIYDGMNLKKVYLLESATPVTYRSQFVPLYYNYTGYPGSPGGSSYSVKMDTRYKLNSTAYYSSRSQIISVQSLKGNSAYVWDDQYDDLLAQCMNADSTDIAYNSFETGAKGRWSYNVAGKVADNTAPTGGTAYSIASGNVTISGLNTSKTYLVSYWKKAGTPTVNSTTPTSGLVVNGWTYVQHTVSNPAGGSITVGGSGTIDELRLFPKNALMNSYSHIPIVGIGSQSDATNRISY